MAKGPQPVNMKSRLRAVPFGRSAGHLRRALAVIFASVFATACRHAQILPSCPPGAHLMGAPPPKASEVWCQKTVNGRPLKDGPFIVYGASGDKMIQGTYRNGVQEGEWTFWYENGARASIDHYVNGVQIGVHTSWYANGQKAIEGEYQRGKREGVWTQWDPGGLTSHKMVYRGGKLEK